MSISASSPPEPRLQFGSPHSPEGQQNPAGLWWALHRHGLHLPALVILVQQTTPLCFQRVERESKTKLSGVLLLPRIPVFNYLNMSQR